MEKTFLSSDFKIFEDARNIMKELFSITCSLCGDDDIKYVSANAPESIGNIANDILENNPKISDEDLDAMLDEPISIWQQFDDENADNLIPTFACEICYEQLLNGEIKL
ncbi:hypothetical protein [Spiroplasma alleghenense]|uniref:Uncharacterized protein n=1 Tax=Spiroplasma alleghenense TaxID=216931 RepID=A0A345Z388_9MOLU|nr:hypothetical protein [Spiroplasma alleghenense]AXK51067.1 hypothetical protein SALLE_v1c03930 [Spiroplasma alleghenense]